MLEMKFKNMAEVMIVMTGKMKDGINGQQAKEKLILSQAHRIVTVQNFSFLTGLRVNYENVEQFKKKTTRHFEYNETFRQANE